MWCSYKFKGPWVLSKQSVTEPILYRCIWKVKVNGLGNWRLSCGFYCPYSCFKWKQMALEKSYLVTMWRLHSLYNWNVYFRRLRIFIFKITLFMLWLFINTSTLRCKWSFSKWNKIRIAYWERLLGKKRLQCLKHSVQRNFQSLSLINSAFMGRILL